MLPVYLPLPALKQMVEFRRSDVVILNNFLGKKKENYGHPCFILLTNICKKHTKCPKFAAAKKRFDGKKLINE